jgi:hypothetical protein
MYFNLYFNTRRWHTSETDPNDSWDRPNSKTEWSLINTSISLDRDNTYSYPNGRNHDIEFKPNKLVSKYYCVYAIYSTGDSFGHDASAYLETLEVFLSRQEALDFIEALSNVSKYEFIYKDKKYYIPWTGYFESLDSLEIAEGFLN